MQQRLKDQKRKQELEDIAGRLQAVEDDDELMDAIDGALEKRAQERDVAKARGMQAQSRGVGHLQKATEEAMHATRRANESGRVTAY